LTGSLFGAFAAAAELKTAVGGMTYTFGTETATTATDPDADPESLRHRPPGHYAGHRWIRCFASQWQRPH
jgi:hypothetical protein